MTARPEPGVYGLLTAILADTPKLTGALCVGRAEMFDERGDDESADEAAERRGRAAALCTRCPARVECSDWVARQPSLRESGAVIAADALTRPHPHRGAGKGGKPLRTLTTDQ